MMFVDNPWPVAVSAVPSASIERRARSEHLALGVLASGDRADLVVGQDGDPPDDRLDRRIDRAEERVDRAVAVRLRAHGRAEDGERDLAARAAAVARGDVPAHESHRGDRGRGIAGVGRLLFDERDEVGVGHLLLHVRQGDRRPVDAVERLALEVVTELLELALQAAPARELADRQPRAREADRLRRHDLVRQRVLEHAVLVDARFVRERVASDDRLVRLDREAGQV